MNPAIPHLLNLQRLDQRIAALRAELDAFPKRIKDADVMLSTARAALAAAKERHSHAQTERKKFELDVNQWRDRARKYRDQSASVKTNEAYKALQHEIAHAESEAAAAEDRQLEQMMAVEETEREIKAAESALKAAEVSLAAERKQIESQGAAKRQELDADLAEREKISAQIPEEILTIYTRVAKRHHGVALAEAATEQCRGCGMRLLPHTFQEIRQPENHEIIQCETCSRILYAVEPAPPAKEGAASSAS
ncbi:MAG TPA: C4-type zinc ribbon domain-containing protein [Candidatus Sulfotelmatobacter sp.]|jgi:predicted  nucleic acid-binding Zn-ribbon protein|nr:C4-type zinc ribbon domain-containing protein [Candidatus Sulfotelmatobacter sp.]